MLTFYLQSSLSGGVLSLHARWGLLSNWNGSRACACLQSLYRCRSFCQRHIARLGRMFHRKASWVLWRRRRLGISPIVSSYVARTQLLSVACLGKRITVLDNYWIFALRKFFIWQTIWRRSWNDFERVWFVFFQGKLSTQPKESQFPFKWKFSVL